MSSDNHRRLHLMITGRVQGVGFRHHVLTSVTDRAPSVVGAVRNRRDGNVEIIAEGPENELQTVKQIAERGPRTARVHDVRDKWRDARGDLGDSFEVAHHDGSDWSA